LALGFSLAGRHDGAALADTVALLAPLPQPAAASTAAATTHPAAPRRRHRARIVDLSGLVLRDGIGRFSPVVVLRPCRLDRAAGPISRAGA
jgi:hypothetical protein